MHFMCMISFNFHKKSEVATKHDPYLESEFKNRTELKNCTTEM